MTALGTSLDGNALFFVLERRACNCSQNPATNQNQPETSVHGGGGEGKNTYENKKVKEFHVLKCRMFSFETWRLFL